MELAEGVSVQASIGEAIFSTNGDSL